jgi:hypothetical protein
LVKKRAFLANWPVLLLRPLIHQVALTGKKVTQADAGHGWRKPTGDLIKKLK